MNIFTIGFTKKSAEAFFGLLRSSGAKHLLDIRLENTSQLAGFTKRTDLPYFLKCLTGMEYHEMPGLAPEKSMLKDYRKTRDWATYERRYLELIRERQAEKSIPHRLIGEGIALLCSEAKPDRCHRRLAAEYLVQNIPAADEASIVHL